MANSVVINVIAKVGGLNEVEKFKSKLNSLTTTKGFKSAVMGVGMGAGFAAFNALGSAIGGATDFLGSAIDKASALAESTSKMNVVFGKSASVIEDFGKTSASAFGLSKQAAYEAAGTFGNLFLSIGMGQKTAADMSVAVTKLAADLASFNNVDIATAMAAIRSGLVGESEPMRQFGVLLNETAVKAKGVAMGLTTAKGTMSDAAKVQARYALILEQTGTAQGDFARTSDGLANTQRALQAEMDDLSAAIGDDLLPIMLQLAKVAKNDVIPAIEDTMDAMGHLGWAMEFQRKNTDKLMFWQRGLSGLWTDGQQSAEAYAQSLKWVADTTSAAAAEGAGAWDTYSEKAATAREATKGIAVGAASAMAPIIASARQARDALRSVTDAFKEVSRTGRDNLLETAYDAKRLPNEIVLAQQEVADAHKARYHASKKLTKAERAEANLRVINASEEVSKLTRKNADLVADYGKTGTALGEALMLPFSQTVARYSRQIDAMLRAIGRGVTYAPPRVTTPTAPSFVNRPRIYEPDLRTGATRTGSGGGSAVTVAITNRPIISVRDVELAATTRARYTVTAGSTL